MSNIFA